VAAESASRMQVVRSWCSFCEFRALGVAGVGVVSDSTLALQRAWRFAPSDSWHAANLRHVFAVTLGRRRAQHGNGGWCALGLMRPQDMGSGKVAGLGGGWRKEARARYASAEEVVGEVQSCALRGCVADKEPEGVSE
jgi:hypothetical protein